MSDTKTLLLEIHCEEIPARFLKPLTDEWASAFQAWRSAQQLGEGSVTCFYSPRKLAWRVEGLPVAQPNLTETQVGPPQRLCLEADGRPTLQGQKFAEKWDVPFEQVRFEQPAGKKEPCATVTLTRQGRPTLSLLEEALPRLVAGLHVPKAMRWGSSEFEFVRPIRNVLCLLAKEVVPIVLDGVQATDTTWGHRLYHRDHLGAVAIQQPADYEVALAQAGVVVSCPARRDRMQTQMNQLAASVGGRVVEDAHLLDTLAEIVEYPKVLLGEFPKSFLELPKAVLVTSLKEHQKAFCVEDQKGALLPYFLTAANRADDPQGFVKSGNEWVLKARLYDARFFLAEDAKHPLSDRLEKLKNLTFHRELGSYQQKTERVEALASSVAHGLGLDTVKAARAARLSKCDLVTLMVGEFPELQGTMGGWYLAKEGADAAICQAVGEHYQPISAEGSLPSTPLGCLLSMVDKLDTLVGCFAIGQIPSGSKDPLALRRAGQGIARILWEQGWGLNVDEMLDLAVGVIIHSPSVKATQSPAQLREALLAFFKDRVAYQLELAGYASPVRRSALATSWVNLRDLKARCEALSKWATDPRLVSLAQSAKRIGNILKDEAPVDTFDAQLLQQPEEKALDEKRRHLAHAANHSELLDLLASMAAPLEAFFNAVMVKCEDAPLRAARLSLLHQLRQSFNRVADFSVWQ